MQAEPQKEHGWLARLVGEWEWEHDMPSEPGQAPVKFKGRERVRMLGELWMIAESEGTMPDGGIARMMTTLGYDPAKKKFVGSFIGSMMSNLWPYEGELDATGTKLMLDSEGPSFSGDGSFAKYRDTIEVVSDDLRILSSEVRGDDGAWTEFMSAEYRRIK